MFGGAIDNGKSNQCSNLTLTVNFLENTQNTTVILMEVPVRYDAGVKSQISEQIVSYNKKLYKVTKKYKHVKLAKIPSSRNYFTTHGLHLNYKGKEVMTKEILNNLTSKGEGQSLPVIKLPWKNACNNIDAPIIGKETSKGMIDRRVDTEETRKTIATTGVEHTECETGTAVISKLAPNETIQHIDGQEKKVKPPETDAADKEISRNPKSQRKCPKVKNDAFLWT